MAYVNGEWQPDNKPTGPYGATWNGMVWDPASRGYVAPTQPATQGATIATATEAGPQAAANTQILKNQAATTAPGYQSPTENIQSLIALRALGAPTHTTTPYTDPNELVTQAAPKGPAWSPDLTGPSLQNPSGRPVPASVAALDDPAARAVKAQADFRQQVDASLAREAEQRQEQEAVAAERARQAEIVRSNTATDQQRAASLAETTRSNTATDQQRAASLAETTRSNVAGERQSTAALAEQARQADLVRGAGAANLAETAREATANEHLAAAKFDREVQDRSGALAALTSLSTAAAPAGVPSGGSGSAPAIPAYDPTADTLAYTAAREKVGNETAGALNSLRGVMTTRGIGGTGIEANNTRGIVLGGLKNLASGDLAQAAGRSAQAYDWARTMAPLTEQARQFNVSAGLTAQQQAAQIQQQKIDALLRVYGSQY